MVNRARADDIPCCVIITGPVKTARGRDPEYRLGG